jgi:hypothetical protein
MLKWIPSGNSERRRNHFTRGISKTFRIPVDARAGLEMLEGRILFSNLLANGDFSGGKVGFTSQYVNAAQVGGYVVGKNPIVDFGSVFSSFGDHTNGKGKMLIADAAMTAGKAVWQETVAVAKNKNYDFSGWAASDGQVPIGSHIDPSPARLALYVNGVRVGDNFTVKAANGKWSKFTGTWKSGTKTSATIKIVDLNTVGIGNDFALDDLNFAPSTNLLNNGDFAAGRTGFSTQYANSKVPGGLIVAANPTTFSNMFTGFGDHTTGVGQMLVADGNQTANKTIWQETVNVGKNRDYQFSGFAASVGQVPVGSHKDPSPARLAIYVNGVKIGNTFTVNSKNGSWGNFTTLWHSLSNTTATIKVVDLNTTHDGNDFALDDLSFAAKPAANSFSLNLATGQADAIPTSLLPFVSYVSTPAKNTLNPYFQTVLRLNLNNPAKPNPFKTAVFTIHYAANCTGMSVNIGDSISNNGFGGDGMDQSNDAEVQIGCNFPQATAYDRKTLYVFGKDGSPSPLIYQLEDAVGSGSTITLTVGDGYFSYEEETGHVIALHGKNLFSLNGQADSEGPVNYDVFAAFNRCIDSHPVTTGSGVDRVTVTLSQSPPPPEQIGGP